MSPAAPPRARPANRRAKGLSSGGAVSPSTISPGGMNCATNECTLVGVCLWEEGADTCVRDCDGRRGCVNGRRIVMSNVGQVMSHWLQLPARHHQLAAVCVPSYYNLSHHYQRPRHRQRKASIVSFHSNTPPVLSSPCHLTGDTCQRRVAVAAPVRLPSPPH